MSHKVASVNPEASLDVRNAIEQFTRSEAEKCGETIYAGRRNQLIRFRLGDEDAVVKCFRKPHLINRIAYRWFRKSKARRSFENGRFLIENGFNTPEPIAWIEHHSHGQLTLSYYFSKYVAAQTLRDIEKRPEAETILRSAAYELARMHALGIFMRDYSPGNVMYILDDHGSCTLYYVDLNRIDFNVHDRNRQFSNFDRILWDNDLLVSFAGYYAEASGLDPESVVAEAIRRHTDFRKRHQRRERIKKRGLFRLK